MTSEALKATAEKLVSYCREGKEQQGLGELYAPDAVSVEAMAMDGGDRESRGVEAIRAKHAWWNNSFQVHDLKVEGPFLHGDNAFAVIFEMETSPKAGGERTHMREVAVYHADPAGKIVREEFFYG
jgi:ketosteroid isomerase-like protein